MVKSRALKIETHRKAGRRTARHHLDQLLSAASPRDEGFSPEAPFETNAYDVLDLACKVLNRVIDIGG